MLAKETDRNFIVYPSWADLSSRWEDLPRDFADPLNSGFFQPNFDPRRFGYPEDVQPYQLIDGPAGGGLVVWWGDPSRGRFLPLTILSGTRIHAVDKSDSFHRGANILEPNGVRNLNPDQTPHDPWVCFLEPIENRLAWLGVGRKTPMYNTALSFEHAISAGDRAYWVVRHTGKKGKPRPLAGFADLPQWASAFGVKATPLNRPPEALNAETDPWFTNPKLSSSWFLAESDDTGRGYQFAVLVYLGNHLRHVAGAAMKSMHLVAQIEGEPHFVTRWTRPC